MQEQVATGRRKTAVASVRLRPGNGQINVNNRSFEDYFPLALQRDAILAPFKAVGGHQNFDLIIRVNGGGIEGQVMAIRLGLSRALILENKETHHEFKELGYLTRDPRKRERKKYGRAGARKRFQFSKR